MKPNKTYPNGKTYTKAYVTVYVDKVVYKAVEKHLIGAIINELHNQGITNDRITKKYTFNS